MSSLFLIPKDKFDDIPILVAFILESESKAAAGRCDHGAWSTRKMVHEIFLTEFRKEHLDQRLCSRQIESNVEQVVGIGVGSSVQPISLITDPNYSFIDSDVIWIVTVCRL